MIALTNLVGDWRVVTLTAELAAATTAILAVFGLPVAYWLAKGKARGRFLVEATLALPLVLPPTVIGFYVLMALGVSSPVGRAFEAVVGTTLPFSFAGILLGSLIYNVPFSLRPFTAAFEAVDGRLIETARTLGMTAPRAFVRVALPLAWPGILSGLVLTFAHTVGEFGVVLMLGGNIPGVTRTLSVAIFDDVQAMDFAQAGRTSFVLLLFAFLALAIIYSRPRRPLGI